MEKLGNNTFWVLVTLMLLWIATNESETQKNSTLFEQIIGKEAER